ncbi:MAG: archease [Nitrospirae bacterium]|nr:archease [Nitrospirota bacterium]
MEAFEFIDISGDAGIRAYGETLEDLFANAALGMYSLITDAENIREQREITFDLRSHSLDGLLVAFLNELIFHFDAYGFLGKKILIAGIALPSGAQGTKQDGDCGLKAAVSGEDFDAGRHEKRLLIKAATYHQLRIEKKEGIWRAEVIFDI